MYGVWFAGFMNPQPTQITMITIVTFTTTIKPLTIADSFVPLISRAVRSNRMNRAGILMIPRSPPIVSIGEWLQT